MTTNIEETRGEYIPKNMQEVPCTMCGESDYSVHEIFGYNDKFRYVKCNKCSNVFLNPRPEYDDDFLTTAYDQYGMGNEIVVNKGKIGPREREIMDRYQVAIRRIEDHLGRKGKILDLGCGTGEFLLAARELGWEAHGVDISGPMTTFVNDVLNIPARAGQFHEMNFSDWGKFDAIFCSHVIEHVPFPNLWMKKYRELLVDDGILCLNIPNQYAPEKVLQRLLKTLKLKKDKWEKWRTPDHLYEPHIRSMNYLVSTNGFDMMELFTYSSREKANESFGNRIFHHWLKWGSKIRLFARPNSRKLN